MNLIPANAWYAVPSGALTFVNERGGDYGGLPKDHPRRLGQETGAAWDAHLPYLHPDDHDETRRVWGTCLHTGSAGEVAFRTRDLSGEYRWFLSRAEPLRATDGSLIGWIRNQLRHRRAHAGRKFYLAEGQRLAHSGSWAMSGPGFKNWSSELFRIHGLEPGSTPPSTEEYMALVYPEDRDAVARELRNMVEGLTGSDFTTRIVRADGTVRHVRFVGRPAPTSGALPWFIGTVIDVTEHEQLTSIATQARGRAAQARERAAPSDRPHPAGRGGVRT